MCPSLYSEIIHCSPTHSLSQRNHYFPIAMIMIFLLVRCLASHHTVDWQVWCCLHKLVSCKSLQISWHLQIFWQQFTMFGTPLQMVVKEWSVQEIRGRKILQHKIFCSSLLCSNTVLSYLFWRLKIIQSQQLQTPYRHALSDKGSRVEINYSI